MRMGTCLGFDFYTTSRTSNNPDTLIPTFGHYSSGNAGLKGPSTNQTSSDDSYTISPSNTTAANSSYSLTYVNNFLQGTAYATPLVRAFDSYSSSDGGKTWTAPTHGERRNCLPPPWPPTPGGDVPLFKSGSTSTYATDVKDVVGSTTRNAAWELDGYSNYTNGSLSNAALGTEQLHERAILRLYPGSRLLRPDLLHLAPRPASAAQYRDSDRVEQYDERCEYDQAVPDGFRLCRVGFR